MKEKIKYLLVVLLTAILLPISVFAKESVELKIDKTDLKVDDEVKVTASVPNKMDAYAIMATLKYDKNVFQVVNDSDFTIKNDESIKYSKETNKFGIINKTGKISLNDGDTLFTVNLKVKDDANVGNTNIALTNITYTDGNQVQNLDTTSLKVLITKDAEEGETIPTNKENEIVEDEENIIKVFNNVPIIIILGVLVVIGLITILIINNKSKDNDDKRKKITIYSLIALEVILALITVILLWQNFNKTDVNNDGKKDYHDAEEIIDYLINIEGNKEEEKETKKTNIKNKKPTNKYDVNNDGKVDIEDVGNTTEQIEDNTKVTLKELKEDDEYYVEKGKITLKFTADITPKGAKITRVKIDNKYYKVELVSGVYIVTLDNINDAGVHNFKIEEVELSNGVKRNTNLKITKEVLKDRPVVDDLSHDIKTGELSFTIKDKDKALQNARISIFEGNVTEDDIRDSENDSDIYDEDGNLVKPDDFDSFKVVYEEKLDITKKSFTIKPKLNIGGVYTIVITGNYDLDSKLDDNKNYYEEQFLNNGLNIITVGKVSITAKNTDEIFLAKEAIDNYLFDVEFEPQEIAQSVKQVLVGGEYIDVTYEDGHLKLELNDTKTPGVKNIVISAIKLEDGTDVLCHHEIKYDVLKTKPTITNFVYHKNNDKITFTLEDEDNALKEVNINITDDKDEVFKEEVSLDTKDVTLNNVNLKEGNVYNVNITGDYDLDSDINNAKYNDTTKYNQELTVYDVTMSNAEVNTYHAEKNKEVELKFKADVTPNNDNMSISQITVRNTETKTSETIIPTKLEDETYSATITAPDTAGMHNYEIINVSLDNEEIDEKLPLKINVYKDMPVVDNLLIDESGTKPKITFDLIDNDDAIDEENSYLIITNASNKEIEKIKIKDIAKLTENDKKEITYKNEATLNKTTKELEGNSYNLEIKATYDRHGEGCDMNEQATESLINKEFDIYKATLTIDKYDDYVLKNKDIKYTISSVIEPNKESKNITIDSFILDNEDKDIIKASQLSNSKYNISLNSLDVAGPKEYKINKVILSNNVEISTDATISVEVLKDAPYINKLNLSEDNKSISYELHDPDKAFTGGTITIKGINNQSTEKELQKDLKKDSIEYDFKDGESYVVKVVGSYDLDSKSNDLHEKENEEMSLESFIVGGAYNFTLTNVSITDALEPNETPVITFKSTNSRSTIVNKANVKIDDKEAVLYDVEKIDKDTYRIVLNGADVSYGKHTVTIDDVSMNNGAKTFENNKDFYANKLSYSILKDAPTVKELKLETDKANKNITAKFSLNDPNFALRKLNVILVESNGRIVSNKVLFMDEFYTKDEISVTLSYAGSTDGRYTVKVLADYELGDKYLYTNTNIGEETTLVYSEDEIRIDRMYVVNSKNEEQKEGLFPTKNQKDYQIAVEVSVADSVKARGYGRVSGVTINGVNYPAHQISGYKSKIFINVPADAGVLELTASRVQLANDGYYKIYNDYYSVPEKTFKLDVLKDTPKIENLEVEEDYDNREVTFKFNVVLDKTAEESEFTDGTIKLNNDEQTINVGPNRVTFTNVNQNHTYDLEFKGTYDLDSNKLEGISPDKNKTTKGIFYSVKYGLYDKDVYNNITIDKSVLTSAKNNDYFEKNEEIKAKLKITGINAQLGVTPSKVVINKKEYNLSKLDDDYYELVLDGYSSSGEKTITITDIILSNSKDVKLTNAYTFKPEVLKDNIKIDNYKYDIANKKLTINFDLEDPDNAIVGSANVIITDENNEELKNVKLSNDNYQKEIQVDIKDESILRYYVKVTLDYDRDIDKGENTPNHYANVLALDELISLESNNIELKNITDINVYKKEIIDGEESISLQDKINIQDIREHLDDYFVEVVLENLPDTYAEIKEIKTDNGKLTLVLKYNYVTKDSLKEKTISVDFGTIDGDTANNEFHPGDAFKALLEKLEKGDNVTLEQNYDASSYTTRGTSYVTSDYTGNFDGNGYTIKNLNKPLFNIIKDGEVKDVILKDVTLDGKGHGALAKVADNEKVNGVIVDRVTKNSTDGGEGQNGGLLGVARNKSKIENCGIKNVYLNGGGEQQAGGLIGSTDNSEVSNSYVYGTVRGSHNYTAGLVGNALNSTISNNFTNVSLSGPISCDLACGYVYKSTYTNNIALGSGGNRGFTDNANKLDNNYYLATSEDKDGIKKITKEEVNAELFKQANFSESIWRLDNVSYDNLPIFKSEKTTSLNAGDNELYDESKNNLYNNLMRLMPFYDSDKIIKVASSVTDDDLINKTIKHIVPIDKDGHLVTYLTNDNPKKISELKIIFADGTNTEYKVNYDKTYDMVATYKISGLNIDYNYEHYVINAKSQVVVNLTNYLKGLDYTNNLDILTTNDDSRLYRDFYNENTKNNLEEFVLKYLSNSEYTNTTENNAINNYLEKEVKKDKKIEKVLYAYNYFKRFYDLDIDGIKVYDFIMFNMKGFDESLTPDKIAELYLAKPTGEYFNTSQTNTRYNEILSNYTNLSTIPKFIEYLVSNLSDHDLSEWTHSQFKGILEEIPIDGHPEVKYTLWDHFISESNNEILNQFLPMLTLPEDAAYVISMPVQYIIGAQRTYIVDPSNPKDVADLKARMDMYITRMKRYFATAYSILQDDKLFNDILIYSVDKRTTKTESGTSVHNTAYTTTEPFHKNFVEATGLWAAAAGVNAAAWGPRLEWQVAGILDSTLAEEGYNDTSHVTFRTWSHESAHLIDARLFLRNNGRRFDAGGEDYADNFLMQSFDRNSITMNLSMMMDQTADSVEEATKANDAKLGPVASNLTPERINSPEKIHDFYRKLFETVYVMDYIEAQAFLKLPLETQKILGIQVSYPNETKQFKKVVENNKDTDRYEGDFYKDDEFAKYRARETTKYTRLNELEDFNTQLKTMDDIINNRIMLYPGVYRYSSRGNNSYGGEGINTVHWYQPNNPDGRPDSYALKWISYEMLGWKGYNNGFVEYASNINYQPKEIYKDLAHPQNGRQTVNFKSDSMALKQISNNKFTSFNSYKKYRFNEIKDKLNRLDSEINVDEYIDKFVEALNKDANDIEVNVQKILDTNPGCPTEYWCSRGSFATYLSYQYSTAVRHEIYYKLKTKTNDFRDEIFKETPQQTIINLAE